MESSTKNGLVIKQIHDRLEKQANNTLREKDLTLMQVSVLLALHNTIDKSLSMKDLERHFLVAQSTIVGIIMRLEQKKLVQSFGNPSDKRIKLVHITKGGEACCLEASHCMKKAEETLLQGFSEDEKELFTSFLRRVLENLSEK